MEDNSQPDELHNNTFSEIGKQNEIINEPINENANVRKPNLNDYSTNSPKNSIPTKPNRRIRRLVAIIISFFTLLLFAGLVMFFTKSDFWIYKNWWTYQDNSYGYSIQLPPEWKEAIGNDYSAGVKQFDINKAVNKNDPMISIFIYPTEGNQPEEYNQMQLASPNDYVMYRNVKSLKVIDVDLDDCNAPMIYTHQMEYDYGPRYDVICSGNKHTISLRLSAGTTEILNQYKGVYEKIIKSFKFNTFIYNDPNFIPTPTLSEVEKFLNQPTVTIIPNATLTPNVIDEKFSEYSNGKFTFLYPSNWEYTEYFQQVLIQEAINQTEPSCNFSVTWDQEKYYDSNLERIKKSNWIKISETDDSIGDLPALIIEGALEVDNAIYLRKVCLVKSGGYVYVIDIWNLSTNDRSEITNKMVSSFSFVGNNQIDKFN